MAPKIHSCVGVAGGGKTTWGVNLVEQKLREGLSWRDIGYSSFSKAACFEAARRAAAICGQDASVLQREGFFGTIHSQALRALEIDRKSIIEVESADGRKFLQSACGASPDSKEKGTLAERIAISLSLWDLHRATLGCNVGDIAGILRDDSGWADSVITLCPGHKSLPDIGLRQEYGTNGTDHDRRNMRVPSQENASFYRVKSLFSLFVSRIGGFEKRKPRADKNFGEGSEKLCHYVPNCNSLYVDMGKCGTDHVSRTSEVPSPTVSLDEKSSVFENAGDTLQITEPFRSVIQAYESSKQIYGRLDFTDILLRFLGISVDSDLNLIATGIAPPVMNSVQVFMMDEFQDLSPLLACVAERLSEAACELHVLGDPYQSIYRFAGCSGHLMRFYDDVAKSCGTRTLLNESRRNPECVLDWGECVLSEDSEYESRNPVSAAYEDGVIREGSATLVKWEDFLSYLTELACSDVLVLSRTWFTLLPVKERLDSLGVPWRSCQEKQSSRWECPAKIAYTIALRDLERGELISEQDWRRITDTLPAKLDGIELFTRGTKAKFKKAVCSPVVSKGIHQLHEWGATEAFIDFVLLGHWRREMPALLDSAIEKYGLSVVRKPRIRLGSVHSVKGLEARNVFCLSASTARASGDEADFNEEICLKYVAITRASKNYRLVVNVNDIARSKPQFWAAPKGYWEFDSEPPQGHFRETEVEKPKDDGYFGPVRSEDPEPDSEMDWEFGI